MTGQSCNQGPGCLQDMFPAGFEEHVMNELLSILPWAFGLVAAAAAVNFSR